MRTLQERRDDRFYVIARNALKVLFKPKGDLRPGEAYQCVYECSPEMWDAGTPFARGD